MGILKIRRYTKDPKVADDVGQGCKNLVDKDGEGIMYTAGLSDESEDTANLILFQYAGRMWECLNGICAPGDRTDIIVEMNKAYNKLVRKIHDS